MLKIEELTPTELEEANRIEASIVSILGFHGVLAVLQGLTRRYGYLMEQDAAAETSDR